MIILGIHDGHNSGATLLRDGVIIASVSEERHSRIKNEVGYPSRSIEDVLEMAGCAAMAVDVIVYASNFMHAEEHLRTVGEWYRVGRDQQQQDRLKTPEYQKAVFDIRREARIQNVINHLGVERDRISFVEHHLAHAAAAYFGSPFGLDEPTLILTCDGAGDGLSATVSLGKGTAIDRLAFTKRDASIGKLYSRVTYLLGMTPWEHEYKVMGMAPYADPKRCAQYHDVFRQLVVLSDDGLSFKVAGDLESNYSYFFLREKLERARFDDISGAIQSYVEELLCEWVRNCIAKTGVRRLVCGGGVFMNVKANMRISQLEEVKEMFVFPSCGDESLSLGAAWMEYYQRQKPTGGERQRISKVGFPSLYLGKSYTDEQVLAAIEKHLPTEAFDFQCYDQIEEEVASRLASDQVVARFAGRMEWGARALGNRSILANPNDWRNVEKINSMIKMRDFWMPFAPSLISERHLLYLKNPKSIASPFMMFAYETLPLAAKHLGAAIHPRDKTARAQFVDRLTNPQYYAVLEHFEAKTGIAGVLNTSFNLHGYPLVYSPEEAIYVFLHSGIDCLALEHFLLTKRVSV